MKRKASPPKRKPRRIIHPEFERVMARLRTSFEAAPLILPTAQLYLGIARQLIDEALRIRRRS